MLPSSSSVSQIQQYVRSQQGVIEVARATPDQLLVTVGERVQAMVTGQLPNGRFSVLIKDQTLDLNLPSNTQPGEQLELVVSGKEPRLTFVLAQAQQSAARQVNADVALSNTARMLGELATKPEGQAKVATLQQSQPLFEGVPQTEKLAATLASRLAESGLFYESHQAEWVNGERHLQTLLREPQARLSEGEILLPRQGGQDANPSGEVKLPASDAPRTDSRILSGAGLLDAAATELQSRHAKVLQSELPPSARNLPAVPIEQNVRQLVQQQLALLENNPLVWQGQAWSGQSLHWKTELQNEGSQHGSVEGNERTWQTRLDLTLPRLGALGVSATLREGKFDLRFDANDPLTVKMLRDAQTLLVSRFEAAGLKLSASQVYQHVDETAN